MVINQALVNKKNKRLVKSWTQCLKRGIWYTMVGWLLQIVGLDMNMAFEEVIGWYLNGRISLEWRQKEGPWERNQIEIRAKHAWDAWDYACTECNIMFGGGSGEGVRKACREEMKGVWKEGMRKILNLCRLYSVGELLLLLPWTAFFLFFLKVLFSCNYYLVLFHL